jgi:hypothetical protein
MSAVVCFGVLSSTAAVQAEDEVVPEAQQGGIYTSLGLYGGNTWDIAIDGDYIYTIASGTPNGFFYSQDAGATWQQPAGNNDFGSGQSVDVDHATGTVYIGLGGDLYSSTDHGATLTLIQENAGNPLVFGSGTIIGGWNNEVKISTDNGTTWTTATVDATNSVSSLAASKTAGIFYAVAYDGDTLASTLYVSTNYGATWAAVTTGATSFTAVRTNPYNENYLTIGNDNHLWLSSDNGVTFTEITNAPSSCNTITSWTSLGRMYACSSFTDDGGVTWTQMDFTDIVRGPGKTIEVNSANELVLYGDSMSGVTKSTDGGVTWQNSYTGITAVNVEAISYTTDKTTAWVSSTNGLAKTTDFNSVAPTWEFPVLPCAPERCDPSGIGESVWVKPDDSTIVLAGSIGGFIFRSADSGETWVLADAPSIDVDAYIDADTGMNILRPYQFVNDPNDPTIVYAALSSTTVGVLLKSTDSGENWTDMGLIDDAPAHSIAVSETGIIYVGAGNSGTETKGVYKYSNDTWEKLTGISEIVNINSIMIDPDDENILYVAASGDSTQGKDGFYKSIDAGANWTKIDGLTDYYEFSSITIQNSTTPNTLYVSCRDDESHGILLKSSDLGETWGVLYTGLKSETFNTLVFDGLVVGSEHGLFSLKSKAHFKSMSNRHVSEGAAVRLSSTLKDKTTKKLLKNKKVILYQKHGTKWQIKSIKNTNSLGKVHFSFAANNTHKYRMTWKPRHKFAHEYARTDSKAVTITVK